MNEHLADMEEWTMSNAWIDARDRGREWPHGRAKVGKDIACNERIVVTFGLHKLEGNNRAYWSITAEVRDKAWRGENAVVAAGAMGDEITQHFPELAPFVALHLSDDTGTPVHAVENARYWLGLTEFQTANVGGRMVDLPHKPYVMSHLRIAEDEYAALVSNLDEYREHPDKLAADIADRWAARWAQESADALALLATYV